MSEPEDRLRGLKLSIFKSLADPALGDRFLMVAETLVSFRKHVNPGLSGNGTEANCVIQGGELPALPVNTRETSTDRCLTTAQQRLLSPLGSVES